MVLIDHIIIILTSLILSACIGCLLMFCKTYVEYNRYCNKKIDTQNRHEKWQKTFKEMEK